MPIFDDIDISSLLYTTELLKVKLANIDKSVSNSNIKMTRNLDFRNVT